MQKIQITASAKISALQRNEYFAGLNEATLGHLQSGMQLFRYEAGEIICWQGEDCLGLFTVRKGSVKLFRLSPKGRELIIRVLEEAASFNEVPVFDLGLNAVNVAALETS